jgi:hypothetical protein
MIRYALICDQAHPFEAWFGSSDAYDDQASRGLVECPFCGSKAVRKQIMAPAVVNGRAPAGSRAAAKVGLYASPEEGQQQLIDRGFSHVKFVQLKFVQLDQSVIYKQQQLKFQQLKF